MVNLELDLMELYLARDEIKKKNALKRQVAKVWAFSSHVSSH